ncbi:MAG: glycosyltransferase family 39 protein, partial [Candidatus Oleimicrobiaceae bacterium]
MKKWWPLRWWVWAAVAFVFVLVAVSLVPYRHAKQGIDHWARGERADFYTLRLHALLVWAARAIGLLILTFALALRDRLEAWATAFAADWVAFAAEAKRGAAELVRQKTACWVVGAMTIAGCALRLTFLFRPMAYDESAAYVTYAAPPLLIGLSNYFHPGNHMLNTVLVHITTRLFGSESWAIRLPALCAGVLFVPLAYMVVRQLWGAASGVLSAGLIAGAASLVEYSTNGRGYMLGTLWFFMQVGFADYLRRRDNQAAWLLLAVSSVLALYTVASMLYGVGIVFTWLLLSLDMRTPGRRLARLAGTALVVVLLTLALYAPALLVAGIGQMTSQDVLSRWPLPHLAETIFAYETRVWAFWH